MREYIDFPTIYTFKIIGDTNSPFAHAVEELFASYAEKSIVPQASSGAKYLSLSVTVELGDYEELEALYGKIAGLPGLKFHV